MAKYFLNFETIAEYNSSYDSLIKPNVSYIEENNDIKFKPSNSIDGHEYVKIGGIKWATMNIGAESETDYGLYFQWGDTQGYTSSQVGANSVAYAKPFYYEDYKFNNGTSTFTATGMTKYNANDGKTTLETCDDAAAANWGGDWRMPTKEEFLALHNAVNAVWTESYKNSGVPGMVCTDKTDSSKVLFFPAAGYIFCGIIDDRYDQHYRAYYWSSSLFNSVLATSAYSVDFSSSNIDWGISNERSNGIPVRPVHN